MKRIIAGSALAVLAGLSVAAQEVTSVNAVGVIRIELKPGLNLISTPFVRVGGAPQTLADVFGDGVPDESQAHLYDPVAGYSGFTFFGGSWFNNSNGEPADGVELGRGQGLWFRNPAQETVVLSLVGEVPAGPENVVALGGGIRIVSFGFPADRESGEAGVAAENFDELITWSPEAGYGGYTYYDGAWYSNDTGLETELNFEAGRAYWYKAASDRNWEQVKPYTWP